MFTIYHRFQLGDSDFAGLSKAYFWENDKDDKDDMMMMWFLPSGKRSQKTVERSTIFHG